MFCLMFRFTVVLPNPKIHEWFMKPVSLILMQIYCIAFSSAYAIPLYSIILKDKELVLSIKGSSQYFNLPLPKPNSIIIAVNFNHPESLALLNGTGRYAIAIVVGLLSIQIFCVGITFYIIKKLRQNAHLFSRKTYTLQIQFTLVLAFQLVSPLIFFLAPICYSLIRAVIHASIFDRLSGNIGTVLLSLYTFSNSLVTVMFVRPYRNYTLAKFGICFGRKCQEFMRQHSQLSGPKLRTNNTSVISVSSGFAYVQHGNAQTQ
ncbi:serpentine type 7TM GPCR chemoreceptor srh domain-containing protein [Ditylenchus destructor]|uniref:Serpentine type 7TM GPCR chemoreceptor srh domain-containing protein n=1 Tax=Ditylenchus destructor TaxID=166010 RepID=A0AAD4N2D8_9BILA|nr:serpentine type 7TM GPCR chemoreceptor srh domain-containing protein [Ditylenchus destructor]